MMKSWNRLCVLVLVISCLSRGEDEDTVPAAREDPADRKDTDSIRLTPSPLSPYESENVPTSTSSPPSDSTTPLAVWDVTATEDAASTTQSNDTRRNIVDTPEDLNSTSPAPTVTTTAAATAAAGGKHGSQTPAASTAAASSSAEPETEETNHSSWGYIILVLILLVIIILCVILYLLRRVSRTYSFDLQRPVPVNHHNEPTGTFEPVYLDDLDRPAPKDPETPDDLSPHPVANGTTLQSEEKASNGETGSQAQPDANGLEASPGTTSAASLGDDPADKTSGPLGGTDLLFDAVGEEQQNENNNNNPSVCSTEPFVEINLDDPAWCDQFLTSPTPPSSVLPFAPFSVSSSSSSSS